MRNILPLIAGLIAVPAFAVSQSTVIDAQVVDVQPIVETVSERIPHEICREETVRVVDRRYGRYSRAVPTAVGAVLGGAVGNVLGRNSSKEDVITVAGAVLGGTIGNNRAGPNVNGDSYYVTEDVCTTEYEYRERERINGYRVSYQYGDSIYETRMDRDPGATIAVRVNLQPLR